MHVGGVAISRQPSAISRAELTRALDDANGAGGVRWTRVRPRLADGGRRIAASKKIYFFDFAAFLGRGVSLENVATSFLGATAR